MRNHLTFAALLAIAALATFGTVALGRTPAAASTKPPRPRGCARITPRTSLVAVERHFGPFQASTVGAGGEGTFSMAGRLHNWTVILQIRPIPRPNP